MLTLGTAKRCITPQNPVRMCGYATRTGAYDAVKEDIFLRVQRFVQGQASVTFIYADLLWWSSVFVEKMRTMLEQQAGINPETVVFVASHNHSGPGTGDSFVPLLETCDTAYTDFLAQQVLSAVRQARQDVTPVQMKKMQGCCSMNVFRRVQTAQGVAMRPNYKMPADDHLTVLGFYTETQQLKGAMIHYPCHANLSNENYLQPDYPGAALRMLESEFAGSNCLFLQGCTADLRPNSVLGDAFVPCDYDKMLVFAEGFAAQCKALLAGDGTRMQGELWVSRQSLALPLLQKFTRAEVEKNLQSDALEQRQWAEKILEKDLRPYETLETTMVTLAGQKIITFNAEVSQDYAAYARQCGDALAVGYANGMIGYLSTAAQIAQGGYEPEGSALYFALAGTYDACIEEMIQQRIAVMLAADAAN